MGETAQTIEQETVVTITTNTDATADADLAKAIETWNYYNPSAPVTNKDEFTKMAFDTMLADYVNRWNALHP